MSRLVDKLAALREECGTTQLEYAQILHISNSGISAFETGTHKLGFYVIIELFCYYDVTTDYILVLSSYNTLLAVLDKEFISGAAAGEVISNFQILTQKQRVAIFQIICDMPFCAEVAGRTNRRGEFINDSSHHSKY